MLAAKLLHLRDEVIPEVVTRHELEHPGEADTAYVEDEYQRAAEQLARVCSLITRVRPVEATPDDPHVVELGEVVTLALEDGTFERRWIVHPLEADLAGSRISAASPLGRALLGRRVSEELEVRAPSGCYRVRILRAERPIDPTLRGPFRGERNNYNSD
jgi:transcription elongation GreA/GreB family factor